MSQEVLVARWTYVKNNDGQKIKEMHKDTVARLYPDFAAEVRRESAKLAAGTVVSYYWQNPGDLENDRGGVIACMKT